MFRSSQTFLEDSRYKSLDDFSLGRTTGQMPAGSIGLGGSEVALAVQRIQQDIGFLKQNNELLKGAVESLEGDRDGLRQGIRKLKVENTRLKAKLRKVGQAAGVEGMEVDDFDDVDFDTLREFLLVGGPQDPFSLRYEADIKDAAGKEHKSAERYLWYKMAETFGDMEAAEKIRTADTGVKAEEEMGKIKNFDEAAWNVVKMKHFEEGQKLKFEQVRSAQNLLVFSDKIYIAVSSQDKLWGTGWRKTRQEAGQPKLWDGENEGGKTMMRLRETLKAAHSFKDDAEKEETKKKYEELKRTFWRRPDNRKRDNEAEFGGQRGGGRGGTRGATRGGTTERGRGSGRGGATKRGRYSS